MRLTRPPLPPSRTSFSGCIRFMSRLALTTTMDHHRPNASAYNHIKHSTLPYHHHQPTANEHTPRHRPKFPGPATGGPAHLSARRIPPIVGPWVTPPPPLCARSRISQFCRDSAKVLVPATPPAPARRTLASSLSRPSLDHDGSGRVRLSRCPKWPRQGRRLVSLVSGSDMAHWEG